MESDKKEMHSRTEIPEAGQLSSGTRTSNQGRTKRWAGK